MKQEMSAERNDNPYVVPGSRPQPDSATSTGSFFLTNRLVRFARSWFVCPLVVTLGYLGVLHLSMLISHAADPKIRFLGLEYYGAAILGLIGGFLFPLTFNIANLIRRQTAPCAAGIASIAGGYNFYWIGFFSMLPILALLNSVAPRVPSPSDQFDQYVVWRNNGACLIALLGVAVTFALQWRGGNLQESTSAR
jgi:hypothetical protein